MVSQLKLSSERVKRGIDFFFSFSRNTSTVNESQGLCVNCNKQGVQRVKTNKMSIFAFARILLYPSLR